MPKPPTSNYAFNQPNTAQQSSSQQKVKEQSHIYTPLPTPNNPTSPFDDRRYQSRTPSPNPNNPLLTPKSPRTPDMPPATSANRNYGPSAARGVNMPREGSQAALLGSNGNANGGNGDYRSVSVFILDISVCVSMWPCSLDILGNLTKGVMST
jgi:hypothetical protein